MKLDENNIYYIACPLTCDGPKNEITYREFENIYYWALYWKAPKAGFIRPALIIPKGWNKEKAWNYFTNNLLPQCDGIILCGNWKISPGCREEKRICEQLRKEIYYYDDIVYGDD